MKALIVEDELLARIGMRTLIDWQELGITLLEDARDGREALKRIEEEHPDVMLLDLNIPEISGLELLKIIRGRCLPVKTIVVSCYDDFETVKEAMKLGAVDYIRKFGLSKEELIDALSNLIELPSEKAAAGLLVSAAENARKLRDGLDHIPPEYGRGYCLGFYMLWSDLEEMADMRFVETIACQYYQSMGREVMALNYEGKLLLLIKEETSCEEARQLLKQLTPFLANQCYIAIIPCRNQEPLSKFLEKAANTIESYGFYGKGDAVVFFQFPVEIQKTYPFAITDFIERLDRGLQKLSEREIMEVLGQLFDGILEAENLSVNFVKKLMIEILSRFSDKARQLGGSIEEIEVFDSYKHYRKIVHITNFEALRRWWSQFVHGFTLGFFTRQKKSESDIIESALEYIDSNLDKTIQLADVARHIGVSEPYLSSFFKKNMHENFIPYVNRQKVKLAKQLFREGRLVYQVSDLLGYENSTYFSKVFKKIEGITPEQYRKNLNGTGE